MGILLPWGIMLHPMVRFRALSYPLRRSLTDLDCAGHIDQMAGAMMACSSVSVVLSSLTLRWWKRPSIARRPEDTELAEDPSKWQDLLQDLRVWKSRSSMSRTSGGNSNSLLPTIKEEEEIPLTEAVEPV